MKRIRKKPLIIILIIFLIYSCSSDSASESEIIEEPTVIEQIKVSSFSKEYAYIGDEVSIIGENFNDNKSKIEVFLDDKKIDVISITKSNITIKIPVGIVTNKLLDLKIIIPNSNITYDDSFQRIAIVDNTKNKWITINHDFSSISSVRDFNAISKEEIYFFLQETANNYPFRLQQSFDGGVYIKKRESFGYSDSFKGSFYINQKGTEYYLHLGKLFRKIKGEENKLLYDFSQNGSWDLDFYVSEDEKNIIIGTSEGRIFSSSDSGSTFVNVYENATLNYQFEAFSAVSSKHVWLAGFTNPQPSPYGPAKMLYLKQDGKWYEKSIKIEIKDGNYEYIKKIHFIDEVTGFAIARINNSNGEKYVIIKSATKGDTWSIVYTQTNKIENFTFKDKNTGWFISGKDIYKTVDGGATWILDYSNDTDCKGILYNDGILWVIANEKLLKYYF